MSKKVCNPPQMNENACLMQEVGIHAKRKRTGQFDSELLVLAHNPYKKSQVDSNQMYLLPCQKAGTHLPFCLLWWQQQIKKRKEKKRKKQDTGECNQFYIVHTITYTLVCCHGEFLCNLTSRHTTAPGIIPGTRDCGQLPYTVALGEAQGTDRASYWRHTWYQYQVASVV